MLLYLSAAEYVIKACDEIEMAFHMLSLICLTVVVEAVPIRNLVLMEVVNQMQVSILSATLKSNLLMRTFFLTGM